MTLRDVLVWIVASLIAMCGVTAYFIASSALQPTAHWTGWLVLIGLILLTLYSSRRLRRLSASTVFLLHFHLGWLTTLAFFFHTNGLPSLGLNFVLWLSFMLLFGSGLLGYVFERLAASRLRELDVLPYPRIAEHRDKIATEANEAFRGLVAAGCPENLLRLYTERLVIYFARPVNLLHHWMGSPRPLNNLLAELDYTGSSFANNEDFIRIRQIVVQKSELDFRYAMYWLQRGWLFVHLPTAAVLAVFIPLHVILVHAYGS